MRPSFEGSVNMDLLEDVDEYDHLRKEVLCSKINEDMKIRFELLPSPNMVLLICGSSLTLISHFLLIFENFQNTNVTLNIHISAK